MTSIFGNNVLSKIKPGQLCKVLGVRLVTNPQVVQLARNAGYDGLFIDLEHSTLSIQEASHLSIAGLQNGVTPLVRVPHQCGNGFVQRVLDGGAMGVVFPHIHNADDAKAAVSISKYPPLGKRSMTGQLPVFSLRHTQVDTIVSESNSSGSVVVLMIETKESIEKVDEIAAVEGVDILLIGSNDLSIELGVPGQFKSDQFREAVEAVSVACRKHGKCLGMAGIYENPEVQGWAISTLGARFVLAQQDSGLIARAAKECAVALDSII